MTLASPTGSSWRHGAAALASLCLGACGGAGSEDPAPVAVQDASADAGADASPESGTGDSGAADASQAGDADADGGSPGAPDSGASTDAEVDPCAEGGEGTASDDDGGSATGVGGWGDVDINVSAANEIVSFDTTLAVPPEPPPTGTLFLWPGLQPGDGADFSVLDNGVLQPVLTWGPTCAPTAPATPYQSWWVSAQYVNTYITSASPNYADYSGCHGGQGIDTQTGSALAMSMVLQGTDWVQTVRDETSGGVASFTIDMLGQAQAWAEFVIEIYDRPPVSDVVFTSTRITFADPEPHACQPTWRGQNDYFSTPRSSRDGRTCCISRVVLRAQGVPATTPDGP